MNSKVSIIIPCYNNEDTISASLLSATNQSYTNKEIIVVDNCSSDNTLSIVKRIASNFSYIKIIKNTDNFGPTLNWFIGSLHASGEYIKYLFSDDILFSDNCIEQMVSMFDQNTAFVYSPCYIDSLDGKVFYSKRFKSDFSFRNLLSCYCNDCDLPLTPSASMLRATNVQKTFADIIRSKTYRNWFSFNTGAGPDLLLHLLSLNQAHYAIHCLDQPSILLKSGGLTEQKYLKVYFSYFMHKAYFTFQYKAYDLLFVLIIAEVNRYARLIFYKVKNRHNISLRDG